VKYAWAHEQRDSYPVGLMCHILEVSRSGYYAWRDREPSNKAQRRQQIGEAVRQSHQDSHGIYGHRKVHQDLIEDHKVDCCKETVRRVMAEMGLSGKQKKRFIKTTDSDHDQPIASNLLKRDFTAKGPDQKWLADITYIRLSQGWLYLAVVLDCYSRRIVGWAMSRHIDADLVCDALSMALLHRCPKSKLLHHSDRGVQYTSEAMRKLLDEHGLTMSMSRKGNPWDNAMMESFFGSLKREWIENPYDSEPEARMSIFKYIELFYNPVRRHSSLGGTSPVEYERRYHVKKQKSADKAA
jgi:putative transposase